MWTSWEIYYHLRVVNCHWPKLFEDDISVIFDRFSSFKCLSIVKNLVNAKVVVVGKLLADGKPLVVNTYLVDTNLFSVSINENVNRSAKLRKTLMSYLNWKHD